VGGREGGREGGRQRERKSVFLFLHALIGRVEREIMEVGKQSLLLK